MNVQNCKLVFLPKESEEFLHFDVENNNQLYICYIVKNNYGYPMKAEDIFQKFSEKHGPIDFFDFLPDFNRLIDKGIFTIVPNKEELSTKIENFLCTYLQTNAQSFTFHELYSVVLKHIKDSYNLTCSASLVQESLKQPNIRQITIDQFVYYEHTTL